MNNSEKSRCDNYEKDAHAHGSCSVVLKLQKNDKIKFRMAGNGPLSHTNDIFNYIEGFLAITLDQ